MLYSDCVYKPVRPGLLVERPYYVQQLVDDDEVDAAGRAQVDGQVPAGPKHEIFFQCNFWQVIVFKIDFICTWRQRQEIPRLRNSLRPRRPAWSRRSYGRSEGGKRNIGIDSGQNTKSISAYYSSIIFREAKWGSIFLIATCQMRIRTLSRRGPTPGMWRTKRPQSAQNTPWFPKKNMCIN